MATTTGNDTWNAKEKGETATWNALAGTDTLYIDGRATSKGAVFNITMDAQKVIHVDSTGGATAWHYSLTNVETVQIGTSIYNLTTMFPSAFGDTVAPTATFSPANNAVDVSNTANIVVTFNEAVKFGTGTITITETGTNNVIATYNTTLGMANNANVSISGTTLTINPTADLGLSTGYTVALSSGSIKDTAGNNYAGNVAANYHFTTASGPVVNGTAGNDTLVAPTIDNTTMNGLAGNDTLTGSSGDDRLNGGAGNDSLNGGAGADTMTGGTGNDIYVVDTGDMIVEAAGVAGGIDTIQSDATYSLVDTDGTGTLGSNVENLTLTGSASIDGTGNALANKITGNSGNNVLTGGAGIDTLNGGAGNDTYHVNLKSTMVGLVKVASLQDAVAEGAAAGTDTIVIAAPATAITLTVASAITLGANIENLDASLTGLTKLTLVGNGLDNILTGNDAANAINGGLGNDTLFGGAGVDKLIGSTGNDNLTGGTGADKLIGGTGSDTLTGGADADVFIFNTALNATTNLDVVTDFTAGSDHIYLENAIFGKLLYTGILKAANFYDASIGPTDANDFIGYDSTTGALYYDANGSGAGGAVQFATLSTHPTLTVADIVII